MRNWEPWKTTIEKSNNHRMLQQLAFHSQQTIKTASVQDLPQTMPTRPYWPTRWCLLNTVKTLHTRWLGSLWLSQDTSRVGIMTTVFLPQCGSLSSTPVLGCLLCLSSDLLNHLQTCQTKSVDSQAHDWVVNWEHYSVPWVTKWRSTR